MSSRCGCLKASWALIRVALLCLGSRALGQRRHLQEDRTPDPRPSLGPGSGGAVLPWHPSPASALGSNCISLLEEISPKGL